MADPKMTSFIKLNDAKARKFLGHLQKNVDRISTRDKKYITLLGAILIADVWNHFEKEEGGPNRKWREWSKNYRTYMTRIGKGGNKILQDTGNLKNWWAPVRYRVSSQGVFWFNPVPYARAHDEGLGVPKRKFTWISSGAIDKVEKQTAKFFLMFR